MAGLWHGVLYVWPYCAQNPGLYQAVRVAEEVYGDFRVAGHKL